ncbi:MAG: hypothetical protein E6G13_00590 [Actinobacteria bacterium]|nr:MAG: hypothetical protein E6G13_00590 [Actinomycetota bacterium]
MTSIKIRSGVLLAATAGAVVVAGTASAHMPKTITIRHQMRGCHSWSVANGPWRTGLKLKVDRDTSLFFVNDDVMPHRLIQTAGPRAHLFTPNMNRLRAHATVTFGRAGVYRFTTKPGHDYKGMHEMKMGGKDNVLRLTITVA